MKILLLSHKHPPSLGGMETQSFFIAKGLKEKHEVIEIIFKGEESRLNYFRKLNKRVKAVLLKHPDISIIHLNDGLMAFIMHWLTSYTKVPIIITFHGLDLIFPQSTYQKRLKKFITPQCYAICVSKSTYDEAHKRGFKTSNLVKIDNGVDHHFSEGIQEEGIESLVKKYSLNIDPAKDKILVSIGRAVPRKGFSWFIANVMPRLGDHTKYVIIGPNNVSPTLRKILAILPSSFSRFLSTLMGFTTDFSIAQNAVNKLHLEERVSFLNGIPFPDLVNFMKSSSLMVMPNVPFHGDMEGFGLVILEANMCKKYVVGSNLEGISSAIHPLKNGELLPTQNTEIWVRTIVDLLRDPDKLAKQGEAAYLYTLQNFGWNKMVDEYITYFEKIAKSTI